MALTLHAEQELEKVNLIEFYENSEAQWKGMAADCFNFLKQKYPNSATIRMDDVAKILMPLLEIDVPLTDYLDTRKLRQKYWIRDFCDLILDRAWPEIS